MKTRPLRFALAISAGKVVGPVATGSPDDELHHANLRRGPKSVRVGDIGPGAGRAFLVCELLDLQHIGKALAGALLKKPFARHALGQTQQPQGPPCQFGLHHGAAARQ